MADKIDVCLIISFLMLVPLCYITLFSIPPPPRASQFDLGMLRNANNFAPHEEKVAEDLFNILGSKDNENHKLIFLLGGPGVGKANLTYMINKSIKQVCKQNEEYNCAFYTRNLNFLQERTNLMATLCDTAYYTKSNTSIIYVVDYINDFKNTINNNKSNEDFVKFYNIEDKCLKKCNLQFIHIITGPIMTEDDIDNFKNVEEYETFINETAKKLDAKMHELAPQLKFFVIQFKPMLKTDLNVSSLRYSHMLFDSELWQIYANYTCNKDFIPHGEKFANHLIKQRLTSLDRNNIDD